jgi:hypothetical protein
MVQRSDYSWRRVSEIRVAIDVLMQYGLNELRLGDLLPVNVYDHKPKRFLTLLHPSNPKCNENNAFCAGFELSIWRYNGFAEHLIRWLPDYALAGDYLKTINHANAYDALKDAAIRVYKTAKYDKRGDVGQIAAHCICRGFFNTIPIAPFVYYKSASNDYVKGFDLVHASIYDGADIEIWLGEAKIFQDRKDAVEDAIRSIRKHVDAGVLKDQKLLIGPIIPPDTPKRELIARLFDDETPLDQLVSSAVFPVVILAESDAIRDVTTHNSVYTAGVVRELQELDSSIQRAGLRSAVAGLRSSIRLPIFYVPLSSKADLLAAFDRKLRALQE